METDSIKIFIGYDTRIPVASTTLMSSITERASMPVNFNLLNIEQLQKCGLYKRENNPLQSTEFSFSRFLAPVLSNFEGWSIFMDNDIIALDDIANLWKLRDEQYAVMCVKHDHNPNEENKFMGEKQTKYEKKNWSSVMLFNNSKCKKLTPDYVNGASGLELHQFKWLSDDSLIGELPQKWNYLADYTKMPGRPSLVHYTSGGPFYPHYNNTEFAAEWFNEFAKANYCKEAGLAELTKIAELKMKNKLVA